MKDAQISFRDIGLKLVATVHGKNSFKKTVNREL